MDKTISFLGSFDTEVCADTVEFSPSENPSYVLCGTYQLNEEEKCRIGKVFIFQWRDDGVGVLTWSQSMAGILDSVWCSDNTFTLALASGSLSRYRVVSEGHVDPVGEAVVCETGLTLSVDHKFDKLAASDSAGCVSVLSGDLSPKATWRAHDYEAWVATLSSHHPELLFSGGDDCRMCVWDERITPITSKPTTVMRHDMGVCSIQCHPSDSNLISSGCYDEYLRVWDLRAARQPIKSHHVAGGVWRHKWCPQSAQRLLIAGMHAGFKVLDVSNDEAVSTSYDRHSSLAYGADWIRTSKGYNVATCSFYDHLLTFWTYCPVVSLPR